VQAQSIAFSREIATADRLSLWGDFVREHIGELEADTFGDPDFDGRLALAEHRRAKIISIAVSRHRVVRTPRLARRDDRGYVKVAAQLQGVACFEQAGRRVVLTPGEWSIYDATRAYAVSNVDPIRQAAIFLPRDDLTRLGLDLDRVVVRRFSPDGAAARGVFDLLVAAQAALQPTATPPPDLDQALADLVHVAALEQDGVATDSTVRDNLKRRVAMFVVANLRDPSLRLDRIASAVGCSKRYLHKLFESEADTLNGFIWRKRLEFARRDFSDPLQRRRTITDIAFSWGFSSSSHFSRLFRDSFGISPRQFRAVADSEAAI
jgi:AraC-like DNA-binding protein